jgi:hypothetical protein
LAQPGRLQLVEDQDEPALVDRDGLGERELAPYGRFDDGHQDRVAPQAHAVLARDRGLRGGEPLLEPGEQPVREPFDFQEPFLRAYFSALGLEDVEFAHTELTHASAMPFLEQFHDAHKASRTAALEAVEALATRVPSESPTA